MRNSDVINPIPGIPAHHRPPLSLFVYGTGDFGQLGLGVEPLEPVLLPSPHTWCTEAIEEGTLEGGVERLAVGCMHSLLIDEAGRVWSWGTNNEAALGRVTVGQPDSTTGEIINSDVLESTPGLITELANANYRAVFVAAGDSIGLAISDKGELRIWGSFLFSQGQVAFDSKAGSPVLQFSPIVPHALKDIQFVQAACGASHIIALTTDGHVYTWGDPCQSAIGRRVLNRHILDALNPERLALRDIILVASGNRHSFAMDVDGVVYAWGSNSMGQLGVVSPRQGATEDEVAAGDVVFDSEISTPRIVEALLPDNLGNGRRVIMIAGGEHHSLFLLSDGSVYACGICGSGQLGLAGDHPSMENLAIRNAARPDNPIGHWPIPSQVFFPPPPTEDTPDPALGHYIPPTPGAEPETRIIHISTASRHNLAISSTGVVYGWGYGDAHQLGMGELDEQRVPARVMRNVMADWIFEEGHAGGTHCLLVGRRRESAPGATS
ncbi:hypothetical protein FRB95_002109 [Tulasnella sp. JGI-2019a]|nr:hypothetical protein FRB95_002109 [Tulasnella sp. JGI-2019a]